MSTHGLGLLEFRLDTMGFPTTGRQDRLEPDRSQDRLEPDRSQARLQYRYRARPGYSTGTGPGRAKLGRLGQAGLS